MIGKSNIITMLKPPGQQPGLLTSLGALLLLLLLSACAEDENNKIRGSGTLELDEVRVSPLVSGRILEVKVEEGQYVKEGQLLYTLSHDQAAADVSSLQSELKAAQRNVDQVRATSREAYRNLNRVKELYEAGSVSKQQYDSARTAYQVATAKLSSARSKVNSLEARLAKVKSRFDETSVVAPLAGTVLTKSFHRGEVVTPGMPVVTIGNLDKMYMKIYVSLQNLAHVKPGDAALIHPDGLDDTEHETIKAVVARIADRAEFTPKNVQTEDARARLVYEVKLRFDNTERIFKPGMMANAEILLLKKGEMPEQKPADKTEPKGQKPSAGKK